jgi:hypothetical protein
MRKAKYTSRNKLDNSGLRSTSQHLSQLKRAVKEFDTAWHDASTNVEVSPTLQTFSFITMPVFKLRTYRYILTVPEFRVKHTVLSAKLS